MSAPNRRSESQQFLPFVQTSESDYTFELIIRQQPVRARMIGFGEKDRRPIDPPPILQLIIRDLKGQVVQDLHHWTHYVAHASLWSEDGDTDRGVVVQTKSSLSLDDSERQKYFKSLEGNLTCICHNLVDEFDNPGLFFVFSQVSVRVEGKYRLHFSISNPRDAEKSSPSRILATAISDVFTTFTAKDFPGVSETTPLTKALKSQGVKINARFKGEED